MISSAGTLIRNCPGQLALTYSKVAFWNATTTSLVTSQNLAATRSSDSDRVRQLEESYNGRPDISNPEVVLSCLEFLKPSKSGEEKLNSLPPTDTTGRRL